MSIRLTQFVLSRTFLKTPLQDSGDIVAISKSFPRGLIPRGKVRDLSLTLKISLLGLLFVQPLFAEATVAGIVGGDLSSANLNTSATAYSGVMAGSVNSWEVTAADVYQPVPTSVTLTKLKVKLNGTPGAGKSYTFDIVKNVSGTPVDVSNDCIIADTATTCEITISVALVQQDLVAVRAVPSGTPTARGATWYVEYNSATEGETIFMASPFDVINTTNTRYCGMFGTCDIDTSQDRRVLLPTSGTFKKLTAYATSSPGGAASIQVTLRKRTSLGTPADTSVITTLTGSEVIDSDNVNTQAGVAGESYAIEITPSGTPAATPIGIGVVFDVNTPGEFVVSSAGGGNNSSNAYCDMQGNCSTTGESVRLSLGGNFTYKNIYVEAITAPAAGGTFDVILRKNQTTDTALTFRLTDSILAGNDAINVSATALDEWTVKVVPTASPGNRNIIVSFLGYIPPTTAISKPPNNLGLVGYWSFNEGSGTVAGDFSGNGRNGTLTNGPTWANGKRGKALSFDGDDDYVIMTGYKGMTGTSARSISIWFKSGGTISTTDELIGWGDDSGSGAGQGFRFSLENGVVWGRFNVGVTAEWGSGLADDKWHHFVYTFPSASNNQDAVTYIDGIAVSGTFGSGTTALNTDSEADVGISINPTAATSQFDGEIDEVRIYNRVLSAAEIAAIYRSGAIKVNSSENAKLTNGLVGMWSFNGPDVSWSANTAYDRSGSNNGTITNMSTTTAPVGGKVGQALYFDGINDYISTSFGPSLTDMTISAWVYLDDSPTAEENILGAFDQAGNGSLNQITFGLGTTVTTPQMYVGDAQGATDYDTVTSSTSLETRRWYHIATVHDADGRNIIYVDGVDTVNNAATTKSDGSMDFSGETFTIGGRRMNGVTDTFFDGKIDEVRMYNRALSATEVKQLYNTGVKVNP